MAELRLPANSRIVKGVTHPASLALARSGEFNDPGMMGHRIAYGATTKINRKDFGLSFNAILDGRPVVSEEIQIMIEGERSSRRRRRKPRF